MAELVLMTSTATIAHADLVSPAQIVNSRSINAIHSLVGMGRPVMISVMTTNAIARTVSMESSVRTTSIGALKCPVRMVLLVNNVNISTNVLVLQAGQENYVTLRWCRAEMQQLAKALNPNCCATMVAVKILETLIVVSVSRATPAPIARRKSMSVNQLPVRMVVPAKI